MPLITNTDFLTQQGYLGSGYLGLFQAQSVLESGLYVVVDSQDLDVETGMLDAYNRNLEAMNVSSTSGLLRVAFDSLQNHIQNQTGQTFNDYLYTRSLKVDQAFAQLSNYLGVTINPQNIKS